MPVKKIKIIIWLVKAAELDVIKTCCMSKLVGLHFDLIYTLPYAMCLNTVSEIISTLEIEEDQKIIATSRFSSIGLLPPGEMVLMQQRVSDFVKDTPVNVDIWRDAAGSFVEKAAKKAHASIIKTVAELAEKPGNAFTLLVVTNDRLPLLEFLALPLNASLKIPADGEVVEMRFEGMVEGQDVSAKLVYAAHGMLN